MEMNEALLGCRRDATADYYLLNVAWMDDWWFIQCPSSNNRADERVKILCVRRRQWCLNHSRPTWQQIYLVEAFTFCTFTPKSIIRKIRSSLIPKVHWMTLWWCEPECLQLSERLQDLWSFFSLYELESVGLRKDGLQLFWRGLIDEWPDADEPLVALAEKPLYLPPLSTPPSKPKDFWQSFAAGCFIKAEKCL